MAARPAEAPPVKAAGLVIPIPLATYPPIPAVVLALAAFGPDNVIVLLPTTSTVSPGAKLILVPLTVTTPPGVSVIPGAMTNPVNVPLVVGEYVFPFIVRTGGGVTVGFPGAIVVP